MPVWTFTSGPNKGKKYEGSADPDACRAGDNKGALAEVSGLLREGRGWGTIEELTLRRDTSVVKTHPRALLASFSLVIGSAGELLPPSSPPLSLSSPSESRSPRTLLAATRFTDVPVVDPSKESGETVAIESNCVQGACVEARMLSAFTCVFRKLSASEAAARKTELEAQEKRRKRWEERRRSKRRRWRRR